MSVLSSAYASSSSSSASAYASVKPGGNHKCPSHEKPGAGESAPARATKQIQPFIQASSASAQFEQGWNSVGTSAQPPCSHQQQCQGKQDKKEGGFLYKAMDAIHSVLDPIPIVGDIAKGICSLFNPEYHASRNPEEQKPKPAPQQQTSMSIALAISMATGNGNSNAAASAGNGSAAASAAAARGYR